MASSEPPKGGKIDLGQYRVDLMSELGRGTFGTVYRGEHSKTKVPVAVKRMQIKSDEQAQTALEEIKKFEKIESHVNVVRLHYFKYSESSYWMVMEFCDLGDLEGYVKDKNFGFETKLKLMAQCSSALAHMHNQKPAVIHRDVKPGNILIKTERGTAVVKLTDFGLSRMVSEEDLVKSAVFKSVVGTPGFMAPELYDKKPYNLAVDIFAMGLVFLALMNHTKGKDLCTLSTMGAMMTVGMEMLVKSNNKQPIPDYVTSRPGEGEKEARVRTIIRQMIAYKPSSRLNMNEVNRQLHALLGMSQPVSGQSPSAASTPEASDTLRFHPTHGHNATVKHKGLTAEKTGCAMN